MFLNLDENVPGHEYLKWIQYSRCLQFHFREVPLKYFPSLKVLLLRVPCLLLWIKITDCLLQETKKAVLAQFNYVQIVTDLIDSCYFYQLSTRIARDIWLKLCNPFLRYTCNSSTGVKARRIPRLTGTQIVIGHSLIKWILPCCPRFCEVYHTQS